VHTSTFLNVSGASVQYANRAAMPLPAVEAGNPNTERDKSRLEMAGLCGLRASSSSLIAQFRKLRLFDILELAFAVRMILMPPPSRARSAASRGRQLRKGLAGLAERNRRTSGRSRQCVRETKAQASPGQSPRW